MDVIFSNFGLLLGGIWVSLELTALGFVGALVLGTVLAMCRVVPITPLRIAAAFYVEVFRNVPLLSLLILVVFGLPDIGFTWSLFVSALICLIASGAAFACEAIRGGVLAIPLGQAEAARAIGLSFVQSLTHVIAPQALRAMVQPLTNVFIGVVLSTSLAAAVGVSELTYRTQQLNVQYARAVPCFVFAGLVYIAIALLGSGTGGWLERRLAIRR